MRLKLNRHAEKIPYYPAAGGYNLPDGVALLASNECPDPPLPEVVAAAAGALQATNRYPDPSYLPLRQALAEHSGVDAERITVGNGSCDILLAIGAALLEPGTELVHAWPSFSVYPHLEAASGATAVRVPLDADHRHDLDAMADAINERTRLVIVCNPNNPTSTGVGLDAIRAFLARVPEDVVVLLDEAYIEFAEQYRPADSVPLLDEHPHLVILRTFSKIYGLAGLRVGYGLCSSTELVGAAARVRQPFTVSVAAVAAATEALRHPGEIGARIRQARESRTVIAGGLQELGIVPAASEANFCWFDLPVVDGRDAAEVEQRVIAGLREQQVLVRSGGALGRPGALRVTYGTPDENQRFLAALRAALS
ncbi:putative aminotransferase [Patulibacter medicamentivorans]|uniref:Histidinol-phosphate aminotransferase n=1 Tax=Patulibacter medicamentivorans TaxID=1097667 RepID=H0E2E5_9ACTN|nr:histidinol-phosphate transaminase [Patulibacter medicamentivorans]EHN12165.1 putative aminotransferase [Patulibacter medicamentivorans]